MASVCSDLQRHSTTGVFVRRMFYSSVEFVGGSGRGESAWGCLGPFDVGPGAGRPEVRGWASEPWASGGRGSRLLCLLKRLPCRWLTGPQSCVSVTRGPGRPCSVSGSSQKGPGEEWLCFALFCLHYLRSSNLALWGHTRHPGEETWQGVGRPGLAARLLPVLFLASCPAVQPQQMLKGMFLKMKNRSRVSRSLSGSVTDRSEVREDAAVVGVGGVRPAVRPRPCRSPGRVRGPDLTGREGPSSQEPAGVQLAIVEGHQTTFLGDHSVKC